MKEFPFDPYDFFGYIASGILVVIGLEIVIGVPPVLKKDLNTFQLVALSIGVYIAGQIVASPAKWLLEDNIVKKILKAPSVNLMQGSQSVLRYVFPGYFQSLPRGVVEDIKRKIFAVKNKDLQGESLFLHIRFSEHVRNDTVLMERLMVFLKKYGFARNLSFTCLLFGLGVLSFKGFRLDQDEAKYAYIVLVVGGLLFYRYLKFFRQYSYELFNTFARK